MTASAAGLLLGFAVALALVSSNAGAWGEPQSQALSSAVALAGGACGAILGQYQWPANSRLSAPHGSDAAGGAAFVSPSHDT